MPPATSPAPDSPPARGGLLKVLGVAFGVAIIVGNTIGAGILRTPGDVAALLPSAGLFLGVWIAGGIYAFFGAMTMAELAVMIPRSGGNYVFARRAFGEYPGFVIGYTDWISTCAAAAAVSIAIGELTGQLVPAMGDMTTVVALVVSLVLVGVHWIGVRSGDRTQQVLSLFKTVALLGVAAACFFVTPVGGAVATAAAATPTVSLPVGMAFTTALVISFQSVAYTYDGWNGVVYFGGEVRDPGREIPRAMALGVVAIMAVYLALNSAFLYVLGIEQLGQQTFAAAGAANVVFGPTGERVVSVVMILSMLGAVSAIIMQGSRVPFALAEDGLMPRVFTTVNKGGTPTLSLLLSFGIIIALVVSGTFATVVALAAFFYVMQYGVNFLAIFVLRRTEPDTPRAYRAWGYPYVTGLLLAAAVAFLVGSFVTDRANTVNSLYVLVASYPIYLITRRLVRRRRDS
ncbi:MAG: APC family permease [Gemmatimonadetes bacterium]|nr:APC family permease [Gemmatimonadota bacterium]